MVEVLRQGSIGGLKTHKASEEGGHAKILIYGEPSVGKTRLAGSASEIAEWSPILVLNIENGALALRSVYPDVDVLPIRTFGQLQKVFDDLALGKHEYKTVVLDNITEGQKQGLEYIFDGDEQSTDFTDFMDANWKNGSWNRSSEQMRKMMRYFRDLPMNVIFVAWAKDHSKVENKVRMGPAFSRSFAAEAPGLVDTVVYYYFSGTDRVLLCQGTERAVAKDRNDRLPQTITDPTMAKIVAYWNNELSERKSARK